MNIKGLYLS